MDLGSCLGLRPLDRVQLSTKVAYKDLEVDRRIYGIHDPDLPWLFFQRVLKDGRLELRSPTSSVHYVYATDICDYIAGNPVVVRAMPKDVFSERLKLPLRDRQQCPPDDAYYPAYVRWVSKNRWGQVDARVQFLDDRFNHGGDFINPIHNADRKLLESQATRSRMPVYDSRAMRGGRCTADRGVVASKEFCKDLAAGLVMSALKGNESAVSALAAFEAKPFKRAGFNKLMRNSIDLETGVIGCGTPKGWKRLAGHHQQAI